MLSILSDVGFPLAAGEAEGEGEPDLAPPPAKSLDMENARLRAEIATLYAMDAARAMAGETAPLQTAPSLSASQRSGQLGSEVTSPRAFAILEFCLTFWLGKSTQLKHACIAHGAVSTAQISSSIQHKRHPCWLLYGLLLAAHPSRCLAKSH